MKKCRFCGIELHQKEDGTGWKENDDPNCPENPSGPQNGHASNPIAKGRL